MNFKMTSSHILPADAKVALVILVYVLMLALLPFVLSEADFRLTFSEQGPFEKLSIIAWLLAALTVIVRIRPLGARAWAFALTFVMFAAREADWHKAFTADSLLKTNYYKHAEAPFGEKLIAGIVAIGAIMLLMYVGFVILRFLFRHGGWRSRAGFWLLFGTVLVVFGKVLDRAPAVLAVDYGIALSPIVDLYAAAFEEGLEMVHPLILAWSLWISQNEKRYLS